MMLNEGMQFSPICHEIGYHGNVPKVIGKQSPDRSSGIMFHQSSKFGVKTVPVHREMIGLQGDRRPLKNKTRKLCCRKDVRAMRLGIFDRFAQSDNTHMVRC